MRSSYSEGVRQEAEALRRKGISLKDIHQRLNIPLSTLSGWLKNVPLSKDQTKNLEKKRLESLSKARILASKRHVELKNFRIQKIENQVDRDYADMQTESNWKDIEIQLAMLYLGEGTKKKDELGLGNSDPQVLKFYLSALEIVYGISRTGLRASLHVRADQDELALKSYWSSQLLIPIQQFKYVLIDKRTIGKPTYPDYYGVCYIGGGGVEIQRRLLYLAKVTCLNVSSCAVSSVGRAQS